MSYISPQGPAFAQRKHKQTFISPFSFNFQSVNHFEHKHLGGLLQISKLGSPRLAATFDTIIQAFIFLDKNGDGKLNKKEMVKALNAPCERSPARITQTRFSIDPFTKDTPYPFSFNESF